MIPMSEESISLDDRQHLEYRLGEIAEEIKKQGKKRRLLAEILKRARECVELPVGGDKNDILEPELVYPIERVHLDDRLVAGIDGGVLSKPLHGLDLILVRAVAAVFRYDSGCLSDVGYYPGEMPVPQLINVQDPIDSRELEVMVGLRRQLTEIEIARKSIEKRDVDALMLDGSIVPQYSNHASKPKTKELYRDLISSYKILYRACEEKNILLLGAIKDSRSTRVARIFSRKILPQVMDSEILSGDEVFSLEENMDVLAKSRDTAFLDYLLEPGERSFSFSYADAPANLLADFDDWSTKINAFYIKPVPYDRPVRIEVVCDSRDILNTVERAASLVYSLSADHEACALPSVLIEADARAALVEEEITMLRDNIADRLEPSTMLDLRRERRPF